MKKSVVEMTEINPLTNELDVAAEATADDGLDETVDSASQAGNYRIHKRSVGLLAMSLFFGTVIALAVSARSHRSKDFAEPTSPFEESSFVTRGEWIQLGTGLDGPAKRDFHNHAAFYGTSIDISDTGLRLAISYPGEAYNDALGMLDIVDWKDAAERWEVQASLSGAPNPGTVPREAFSTVKLSGDGTRVVIAQENQVIVCEQQPDSKDWGQLGATLDWGYPASTEVIDVGFGSVLELSGDGGTLVVGIPLSSNTPDGAEGGAVRVFQERNKTWFLVAPELHGEGPSEFFGSSLALTPDSSRLVVATAYNGLIIRFFDFKGNSYRKVSQFLPEKDMGQERGEIAISADGSMFALAAAVPPDEYSPDLVGRVRVYQQVESRDEWVPVGQTLDGPNGTDFMFGLTLQLSASGQVLAVGTSSGIQMFYYDSPSDLWIQLGNDNFLTDKHDASLYVVAMSPDGKRVAGGDPGWSKDQGHVAVYDFLATED